MRGVRMRTVILRPMIVPRHTVARMYDQVSFDEHGVFCVYVCMYVCITDP